MDKRIIINELKHYLSKIEILKDEIYNDNLEDALEDICKGKMIGNYKIQGERIVVEEEISGESCVIGNLFDLQQIICDDSEIENGKLELTFDYGEFLTKVSHKYFLVTNIAVSYSGTSIWLSEKHKNWKRLTKWIEQKMTEFYFVTSYEVRKLLEELSMLAKDDSTDIELIEDRILQNYEILQRYCRYPVVQRGYLIVCLVHNLLDNKYLEILKGEKDCSVREFERTLLDLEATLQLSEEKLDFYHKKLFDTWVLFTEGEGAVCSQCF